MIMRYGKVLDIVGWGKEVFVAQVIVTRKCRAPRGKKYFTVYKAWTSEKELCESS